ncbi:unnamed protein product [Lathyrus sativus]|nr:unnamed protein product [Lathyrus sativus]
MRGIINDFRKRTSKLPPICGGMWLASTKDGRVAFLTNVRELQNIPQPNTRGDLPLRFLQGNYLVDIVFGGTDSVQLNLNFETSFYNHS